MLVILLIVLFFFVGPVMGAEEGAGIGPLQIMTGVQFAATLSKEIHLLDDASSIEAFLTALDRQSPDWATVYGQGHHTPGLDDRLFALNRERDAGRAGHPALEQRIMFRWSGELSRFDPETGGYSIALGPVFIATRWGLVRFKPDNLPGRLRAVPPPGSVERIQRKIAAGQAVELAVMIIGRLMPEESLVYDFSHDQEGAGLIMPVVRVEEMHYVLSP